MSAAEDPEVASAVFREAIDAYLLIDPATLAVLDANPAALRLTGYRKKEILTLRAADLLAAPDGRVRELLDSVRMTAHAGVLNDYSLRGAGDRSLPVQVTASRLHAARGPLGLLIVRDRSPGERAEKALRDSQRFIERVAGSSPHILYVFDIPSRRNVYANRRIADDLGYSADEVQAMGDAFLPTLIHPDDLARLPALLRRWESARDGEVLEVEYRMRHKDGSWHWFVGRDTTFARGPDGRVTQFLGTAKDITERKLAEQELLAAKRMLEVVINNIPQGVFWKDRDSRYLGCNRLVAERLGLGQPSHIVGLIDADLPSVTPEQAEFFVAKDRVVMATGEAEYAIQEPMTLADGSTAWLETSKLPLYDADGGVIGVVGTWQDVTARHEAEEQRRLMEAQMLQTQKLESLGVLAGGIAHDFNNLLTGILGYTNLAALQLPVGSPARGLLAEAEKTAERAAELVRQLLAYAGKGRFVVQPVDLNTLAGEMLTLLRTLVSRKAHVRTEFAADLPPVEADATQIRQVVMNLITNASEALGEDEGELTLRTSVVEVGDPKAYSPHAAPSAGPGEYVLVEVGDTGCGMSAATLARVFDPFFTTKFAGRGLGLAAVLGIVRGHRGIVRIDTEIGRGTRFQVLFPRSERAVTPEPAREETTSAVGSGCVLVIDDEEAVRSLAARVLRDAGYQVVVAGDGEEGLAAFRVAGSKLRAVLLDLTMPGLGGVETAGRLYAMREDVPVVLMSGYGEPHVMASLAGARFAGFLQKPFVADGLLRALRDAM